MRHVIRCYDPAKKKDVVCGYVADQTYYRDVKNEHYMVKQGGYGIQKDVLGQLVKMGVKDILITTQAGTRHRVSLIDWIKKGKVGNYQHGDQVFLGTDKMRVYRG